MFYVVFLFSSRSRLRWDLDDFGLSLKRKRTSAYEILTQHTDDKTLSRCPRDCIGGDETLSLKVTGEWV